MQASVFIATSLDGFIAREDGRIDWLPQDGGEPHGYEEFISTIDAIVIGRKTFETVLGFGGWFYGKKPVIVLSNDPTGLRAPKQAVCDFMTGAPRSIVADLQQRGFKHLYVDGGVTIQRFLAAGLIDDMTITRLPILLGSGIPLFGPLPHDVQLRHVNTRSYPSGLVTSKYLVLPG